VDSASYTKIYGPSEFCVGGLPNILIQRSLFNAFSKVLYLYYFIPGSFSIETEGGLFNRSLFFHYGKMIGYQDKIVLYGNENLHYSGGNVINIFSGNNIKFGIAVCYDMDFPFYMKILARNKCDVVLNPSLIGAEFHHEWHMYVNLRSLENRIPVVSANSISEPYLGDSIISLPYRFKNGFKIREKTEKSLNVQALINTDGYADGRDKRFDEDPGSYNGIYSKFIEF